MNNYIKILLALSVITNYTANVYASSQLKRQNALTNRQINCIDENCQNMFSILDSATIFHDDFVTSIKLFQDISKNTPLEQKLNDKLDLLIANYNTMQNMLRMINNENAQAQQNSIKEAMITYYETLQEIGTILDSINSNMGNNYNKQLNKFNDDSEMFYQNIIKQFQEKVNDF